MPNYPWSKYLAAAVIAASAVTIGDANAAGQTQQVSQIAQAVSPPAAVTLPEVTVRRRPDPSWYYDPYTSGHVQRPSSLNHIAFQHFKVPAGYDGNVAMHPYTSGLGPCTEHHDLGCGPSSRGWVIKPSHYEQFPFNQ
jgi:hypothetical protein